MLNVKFRVTVSQGHVKNMERFQQEIAIMKARAQRHGMAWDGTMHRSANRFKRSASTCSCMLMAADRIAIPSALALSGARSWTIRTSSNSTRLLKIAGSKDRAPAAPWAPCLSPEIFEFAHGHHGHHGHHGNHGSGFSFLQRI